MNRIMRFKSVYLCHYFYSCSLCFSVVCSYRHIVNIPKGINILIQLIFSRAIHRFQESL
jgi:hypothetical protein